MKVKIVENGVEKTVEASYIIVEDVPLAVMLERLQRLEQAVEEFIKQTNDREKVFKKMVGKL